jgi:hypothetical protein
MTSLCCDYLPELPLPTGFYFHFSGGPCVDHALEQRIELLFFDS